MSLACSLLCDFCRNGVQNPRNVAPASNSRLSPLPPEPADFSTTVDIPLDSSKVRMNEHFFSAAKFGCNQRSQKLMLVGSKHPLLSRLTYASSILQDLKRREKELQAREAELNKREKVCWTLIMYLQCCFHFITRQNNHKSFFKLKTVGLVFHFKHEELLPRLKCEVERTGYFPSKLDSQA